MRLRFLPAVLAALVVTSTPASGQSGADSSDVESIDAIVSAWYDIVSVAPGEAPDWARDSTLYLPDVRFVIIPEIGDETPARAAVLSHAQFIEASAGGLRDGFFEREIHRVTQRFGNMAHVFSTYEFGRTEEGPVLGRGINSIQLFFDGDRWWIVGAAWRNATPDTPIPPEYLP